MYKECTTTYRVKSFTFNIWYSISYIWYSPYNLYSISYIWYLVLIQNYWYLVFTIQLVFNQCYIWSLVFILNYWYLVFSVCSNLFGIWANYPPLSPGGCSTPSWCSLPSPWESVSRTRSQRGAPSPEEMREARPGTLKRQRRLGGSLPTAASTGPTIRDRKRIPEMRMQTPAETRVDKGIQESYEEEAECQASARFSLVFPPQVTAVVLPLPEQELKQELSCGITMSDCLSVIFVVFKQTSRKIKQTSSKLQEIKQTLANFKKIRQTLANFKKIKQISANLTKNQTDFK